MDHLFIVLAMLVAPFILATYFRRRFLNLPPTIFPTIPIIGHLYLLKGPIHRTLATLSAKHGPILFLRFGSRPVLLVSSPSVSEHCFTKNDIIFANRPRWLYAKILGYNYTNLSWAPYGDHWRNLRRISSVEIFSSQRLNEFHDVRADEGKLLIHKLVSECSSPVNLQLVFHELTLNVLMRMISGKRYFDGKLEDEGRQFQDIVKEGFLMGGVSNLEDHLPFLKWFGVKGVEKRMIALRNKRSAFFQGLMEQLRNVNRGKVEKNKKNTMIEVLFKLQDSDPEYYTDLLIRNLVGNLLSAGTDTTASTMEWAFALLLNHTHVLKKAQKEIDNHVGKHRLVNESDLSSLPYLHCIVNETLRLYPSTPLLLPHESSEDCVVEGYHIPRGTMLLVNQWAIQHDPNLWSDPEKFDPERFEKLEAGTRDLGYRFIPFGAGRRICPGDGLAMRMIGLTLGLLIQCFHWERITEEMVDMSEGFGLTIPKVKALVAKCTPRTVTNSLIAT